MGDWEARRLPRGRRVAGEGFFRAPTLARSGAFGLGMVASSWTRASLRESWSRASGRGASSSRPSSPELCASPIPPRPWSRRPSPPGRAEPGSRRWRWMETNRHGSLSSSRFTWRPTESGSWAMNFFGSAALMRPRIWHGRKSHESSRTPDVAAVPRGDTPRVSLRPRFLREQPRFLSSGALGRDWQAT